MTILRATRTVTHMEPIESGSEGWDGHSFNEGRYVSWGEVNVAVPTYSLAERRKALKELKRMKGMDLDDSDREVISKVFRERRVEFWKSMKSAVPYVAKAAVLVAIAAGAVYGIKNCIYHEKVIGGRAAVWRIEKMEERIRDLESSGLHDSAEYSRKGLEESRDYNREQVKKGKIVVSSEDYKRYFAEPNSNDK